MSSTIAARVREIKDLTTEIKSRSAELRNLRKMRKDAEDVVIKFLLDKDQPGIKCDNFVVLSEQKEKRVRKKKSEKMKDGVAVLSKHGVEDPNTVLTELLESMKGNKSTVSCLRTKDMSDLVTE